jgi:lipid-A-disaccharide synthase-like uncharacterized protein
MLHETLFHGTIFGYLLVITGWKLIGYFGTAVFAGRWFVQLHASRKAGKPVMNRFFWLMSLTGSLMLLAYFIFGKNDSVGILSNLFPCFVGSYNLYLDITHERRTQGQPPDAGAAAAS